MEFIKDLDIAQTTSLILAVYGIAQVVVRLTPTPKDDEIVSKIGKMLNMIFSKTNTKK